MDEEDKNAIIQNLNIRIGGDINDLSNAYDLENELLAKRKHLQSCLHEVNNEVPATLSAALKKAKLNSKQIDDLKIKSEKFQNKVDKFLTKTEPLRVELEKRFEAIHKLEDVLHYLKSFEKVEDLSRQLKQCNDDEQAVLLYSELKEMCVQYPKGNRAVYIKEYTHYWHSVLKDKLAKNYDEVLKLLKWPFASGPEKSPPPKEVLVKFTNLTKFLFLIQEPEDLIPSTVCDEFLQDQDPCLPVRLLLRPLKKRFTFHFTGPRQTARIDRPEWFLTQTLTWIKDHQGFVRNNVQPVADKLQLKNIRAVDEFNAGLIALAAERLHTVLAMYHQAKGDIVDVDAAFAHAVDETLGFHRELVTITGKDGNSVLSVLTKAETFVKWLAVEKKYALILMDETLNNPQWCYPIASGAGAATGAALWIPKVADFLVTLLRTIEDRYKGLPQPGHRLQFLELQLELVEEWRVRLTQLLNASLSHNDIDALLRVDSPSHLTAVINAAHHVRAVLLQWAHSLHYLQLHYYRRQFQHFTQQQHHNVSESVISEHSDKDFDDKSLKDENDETISLNQVEVSATKLALKEVSRQNSLVTDETHTNITPPLANLSILDSIQDDDDESGVFGEAPALLAHLRDEGLNALADRILLEFKASLREYKKQKWHAMPYTSSSEVSISAPLSAALAALSSRASRARDCLCGALAQRLSATLARHIDQYIFEEVVLQTWFNAGGIIQFTHDVKRNLVAVFAPPNKLASQCNQLPKLLEACRILNLDYEDARKLRALLSKHPKLAADTLTNYNIKHVTPNETLLILNQRTDLSDAATPTSVLELF